MRPGPRHRRRTREAAAERVAKQVMTLMDALRLVEETQAWWFWLWTPPKTRDDARERRALRSEAESDGADNDRLDAPDLPGDRRRGRNCLGDRSTRELGRCREISAVARWCRGAVGVKTRNPVARSPSRTRGVRRARLSPALRRRGSRPAPAICSVAATGSRELMIEQPRPAERGSATIMRMKRPPRPDKKGPGTHRTVRADRHTRSGARWPRISA